MPIATDPTQRIRIILEADKDKKPQPAFIYTPLTVRQFRIVSEVNDRLAGISDLNQMMDRITECVKIGLVDWENIQNPMDGTPVKFDVACLEDILTMPEMQEMIAQRTTYFSFEDKKKLPSPSDSDTEKSANAAPEP